MIAFGCRAARFASATPFFLALWSASLAAADPPSAAPASLPASAADESFWDSLHDPQDGAFDVSHFLLERTGFLLVPIFITEPAVGNGGGLAAMFFDQPGQSQESKDRGERIPPNIYGGGAVRTENGTNAAFAGGKFHFEDDAWRWLGALGKTSLNLDYYTTNDRKVGYNLDGWFTLQEFAHRIGLTPLYLTARWTP